MADSSGSARHRLNGSRNADSESAHRGPSTEHWPRSRWWLGWLGDGGGSGGGRAERPTTPLCTADTSPSHLHPSSRYHQLIAPSSRNPKQKKKENLPLKNTKEKTEQQRSGHPPPQHLGELLLFSGCSPRPLDIRGSSASRKRWRGRKKEKKIHTHTQAAQRDAWWWGRGLTSLRDWLHVCGGCGGDAAAVYAGSDMVISPIHPRCSRLCAALPSDPLSSPPVVKCERMRRSRNFR